MQKRRKQSGLTLIEMTVVIAAVALLVILGLPAMHSFFKSFETEGGTKTMISAALASARAMAMEEHQYVGIRFQQAYSHDSLAFLDAVQYMIFIVNEEPRKIGNITNGFRAVEGHKPIKLPDAVGVADLLYRPALFSSPGDGVVDSDAELANPNVIIDMTTFSVVFSPSGRLVVHQVRARNKDGRTEGTETTDISSDEIFNTLSKISDPSRPIGMFVQDDYPDSGLSTETSRNSFIIYDRKEFKHAYERGLGWSDYFIKVASDVVYISPYQGVLVSKGEFLK